MCIRTTFLDLFTSISVIQSECDILSLWCMDMYDHWHWLQVTQLNNFFLQTENKEMSSCNTCTILIMTPDFTSNLTENGINCLTLNSLAPLDCSPEKSFTDCTLCGLLFVVLVKHDNNLCVKGWINSCLIIKISCSGSFIII